jgi:hypothetical protein
VEHRPARASNGWDAVVTLTAVPGYSSAAPNTGIRRTLPAYRVYGTLTCYMAEEPVDSEAPPKDGASIVVAVQGRRLPVWAIMRPDRTLLMLFRIRAKYLVR